MKRVGTAITGGAVLILGIIAIPYPGPGWLIVFAGLAILATEFEWARRILEIARGKYDAWGNWLKKRSLLVRLLIMGVTGLIVIATLWLLNIFGLGDRIFHLHWAWLHSPLGIFS